MNFDWFGYLQLAEELYEASRKPISQQTPCSPSEAKARSSISRAYYSAFCVAKGYLRDNGKDAGVHQRVINDLLLSSKQEERQIGQRLDRLRRKRNQADYDDVSWHSCVNVAKQSVGDAKQTIEAIKANL